MNQSEFFTPTMKKSLREELCQAINERNLFTVKTRTKVCNMLDFSESPSNMDTPTSRSGVDCDRRTSLRRKAIEEILTSEKSYMSQLDKLMEYFIKPLKTIIDVPTHTLIFAQIEMIYNLNLELMNELEIDLDNVAPAFLKLAPFFKLYSVYAFDFKQALLTLQELSVKNKEFLKFLYNTESRPEVQTKLNSLLIIPIQRVPRYRLLLQQVLLYTTPADGDYKILQESIKQIDNTVSHINTVIEDQEKTQELLNIQNSLVSRMPNIVKPSRKVIKEGTLMRISSNGVSLKRYCVLMSDIFMYCKILKDRPKKNLIENSLKCCCIFPLKKCKVSELFPGNFKISCHGDGVIFASNDITYGRGWVSEIKEAIELHVIHRKTLRKESSKRKPLRSKRDVENFELDSQINPKKSKSNEYENVCRYDSSSDADNDDGGFNCFNKSKPKMILKRKYPSSSSVLSPKNLPDNHQVSSPLSGGFLSPTLKSVENRANLLGDTDENNCDDDQVVSKKRVKFSLEHNTYQPSQSQYLFSPTGSTSSSTVTKSVSSNLNRTLTLKERVTKFILNLF